MQIDRNRLSERLLGSETELSFVSISEAVAMAAQHSVQVVDLVGLEVGLHAPMLQFLDDQVEDPVELAAVLVVGLHRLGSVQRCAGGFCLRLGAKFLELNGIEVVDCQFRPEEGACMLDDLSWDEMAVAEWFRRCLVR